MKKYLHIIILSQVFLFTISIFGQSASYAQGPMGRNFGFGLIIGEPLGATIKYWTAPNQAFDAYIGGSYFGAPRIGGDYIWHFDAFNSSVVKMYAGPGLALGFGRGYYYGFYNGHGKNGKDYFYYRDAGTTAVAARVIIGVNIIPRRSPVEIFLELGPLIGLSPSFGTALDVAAGIRFYP